MIEFSVFLNIFSAFGGLSGLVSTLYYWKKFKKKLKILPLESIYYPSKEVFPGDKYFEVISVIKSRDENKFVVETNILIINESEIGISITDAIAFVKYSKKFVKNGSYINSVFESSYLNRNQLPLTIGPHSSKKIKLYFQFEAELSKIKRFKVATFLGWLGGKIPFVVIDEAQNEKIFEQRPLEMLLVLYSDGKNIEKIKVPVIPEKTFSANRIISNTLFIEEIKRDYWNDKI